MEYKWTVYAKRADFKAIGETFHIDQVIARVIRNRDIIGDYAIEKYLHGTLADLHDPAIMADMDQACKIMSDKIRQGAKIRIISDYDVDGVTSNYILYDAMLALGANVSYDIPDRILDGYGINTRMIREAHEEGIDTIITCDNGISAFSAVELAHELGMTVVITDHHEINYDTDADGNRTYKLPCADAVVDIKRADCAYPYKELCGAGVAYKFIRQLYRMMGVVWEDDEKYLDILALGTVCDVMELTDENRIFVKYGMKVMEKTKIKGLRALLSINNLLGKTIKVYHLGFVIGPCINAAGRLESAKKGLSLLLETDEEEAFRKAKEIYELNVSRKQMTNEAVEEAVQIVEKEYTDDNVLVVYMPKLHESLAGIVAGRLRENYYKPVLVVTDTPEGMVKGSARSIEGYHMFDALTEAAELLDKFGGHALAAGFSLKKENLDLLRKRLNENEHLTKEELTPVVRLDVPMPIGYVSYRLIENLDLLEPFGKGNEKPIFGQSGLMVKRVSMFGADKNFARIFLLDREGHTAEMVDFNGNKFIDSIKMWFSDEDCDRMLKGLSNQVVIDVAYYPEINEYNNTRSIQLKPVAYRKSTSGSNT